MKKYVSIFTDYNQLREWAMTLWNLNHGLAEFERLIFTTKKPSILPRTRPVGQAVSLDRVTERSILFPS